MTESPRPTIERIWLWYLLCVSGVAVCTPSGGSPGHDLTRFFLLHAAVLLAVLASHWLVMHRSVDAARVPRAALNVIALPAAFTGLCWLLPGVHPEPYEYDFLALDRALFGIDVGTLADHLAPWFVEVLQICYASFYGICALAALGAGLGSGKAAFDRAVLLFAAGFLVSYLGYLLVPTLGPKVVLAFPHDVQGLWFTQTLRTAIDAGEANPWDCFPSGHTMMTVTSLIVLWRWNRRWFCWLLLPSVLLIASTMLLRYHWTIDVLVGALLAWPCARACDWLAARDGWPPLPAIKRA